MTSRHPETGAPAAGSRRRPTTSLRVHLIDRAATVTITLGGISVIVAVLGMLVYLLAVVSPLFTGATVTRESAYPLVTQGEAAGILFAEVDEYRALGVCVLSSGEALVFSAQDGGVLDRMPLFDPGASLTAFSRVPSTGHAVFGFDDGTIRLGTIGFRTSFSIEDAPPPGTVTQTLAGGQVRRISASIELDAPLAVGTPGVPVSRVDYRVSGSTGHVAAMTAEGKILVGEVSHRKNLLTGSEALEVSTFPVSAPTLQVPAGPPAFLLITTVGDQLYLAWRDGTTARFDLRDAAHPVLAEMTDLTPERSTDLTAMRFVTGEQAILVGDSSGLTRAWFRVQRGTAGSDGYTMVLAHTLARHAAGVTSLASSLRDKTVVSGALDGSVLAQHVTSERTLAEVRVEPPAAVVTTQIAPKGDGIFVIGADGRATLWRLDNPHPQTSFGSVFGKVWYEGYPEPDYTWQSSSGTDDFEPKLSLVPLLFGTLKATLYSMLFAVPIAICAAIYTSEFLDPRLRAPLKSTIEMMASLPSVVLGFVAALVLAPLMENRVPAMMGTVALIPIMALALGYLWQALPPRISLAPGAAAPFVILLGAVGLSLLVAHVAAGPAERILFQGDFKAWLDGRTGTAAPGLALLVWPPVLIAMLAVDHRYLADSFERWWRPSSARSSAIAGLARFLGLLATSLGASWAIAAAGDVIGFDARGWIFGTYVQRNALVVGFVMGFAVIPIIYTIAEDALAAVPRTLRSASLGCGATRWQTAIRVVLPVAIPGIFSALMVGLGRAVGETMIVLMAAGNTPLMDLNIFNGLRTLSANIAVELPEAVKDGTLYRTLFLSALLLFALTFVVNTVAEIIRQRFRRKAFQL